MTVINLLFILFIPSISSRFVSETIREPIDRDSVDYFHRRGLSLDNIDGNNDYEIEKHMEGDEAKHNLPQTSQDNLLADNDFQKLQAFQLNQGGLDNMNSLQIPIEKNFLEQNQLEKSQFETKPEQQNLQRLLPLQHPFLSHSIDENNQIYNPSHYTHLKDYPVDKLNKMRINPGYPPVYEKKLPMIQKEQITDTGRYNGLVNSEAKLIKPNINQPICFGNVDDKKLLYSYRNNLDIDPETAFNDEKIIQENKNNNIVADKNNLTMNLLNGNEKAIYNDNLEVKY